MNQIIPLVKKLTPEEKLQLASMLSTSVALSDPALYLNYKSIFGNNNGSTSNGQSVPFKSKSGNIMSKAPIKVKGSNQTLQPKGTRQRNVPASGKGNLKTLKRRLQVKVRLLTKGTYKDGTKVTNEDRKEIILAVSQLMLRLCKRADYKAGYSVERLKVFKDFLTPEAFKALNSKIEQQKAASKEEEKSKD